MNMSSIEDIESLIKELKYYEKGITDKIKKYLTTYTFKSKKQLKEAIDLWFQDKKECIKKYGHMSYWDVSNITDMSWLFSYRTDFNEDKIIISDALQFASSIAITSSVFSDGML